MKTLSIYMTLGVIATVTLLKITSNAITDALDCVTLEKNHTLERLKKERIKNQILMKDIVILQKKIEEQACILDFLDKK